MRRLPLRDQAQLAVAAVAGALCLLPIVWPDWIELTGVALGTGPAVNASQVFFTTDLDAGSKAPASQVRTTS